MTNELKVFYNCDKGLMTFDNKKTIFQHREFREGVKQGLGIILKDNYFDKGNYAFAVFKNVPTVLPESYNDINFFVNKGVPIKIEKGIYGDNVLLKETYKDRTYIRAYKEDGSIGLYESEIIKNQNYEGPNVYFNRLDDLISTWEDITNDVMVHIIDSIKKLTCDVPLSNEFVLNALKGLGRNKIYLLSSGVIVADGKFESLIIWNLGSEVKMAWLGRKLDLNLFENKEITEDLLKLIENE